MMTSVKIPFSQMRGRMEEDDVDFLQSELRAADDWVDGQEVGSKEEVMCSRCPPNPSRARALSIDALSSA